jgi:serine/threonine protein kinase
MEPWKKIQKEHMEKKLKNIGERYLLEELIAESEVKATFRGHDLLMDRKVAVKVLHNKIDQSASLVSLFWLEAKKAASLDHANIMPVCDYGSKEDIFFMVMPWFEGCSLRYSLQSDGRLSLECALTIACKVALGLAKAHRLGIIHGAVKPENVLIGRGGAIKLTDFGIASITEQLTGSGILLEATQYSAPEQMRREILSPAADIYACGRMMYEMLTGQLPDSDDAPVPGMLQYLEDEPELHDLAKPSILPKLEQVVLRCLEKEPEMRFRNGFSLAYALEEASHPGG